MKFFVYIFYKSMKILVLIEIELVMMLMILIFLCIDYNKYLVLYYKIYGFCFFVKLNEKKMEFILFNMYLRGVLD